MIYINETSKIAFSFNNHNCNFHLFTKNILYNNNESEKTSTADIQCIYWSQYAKHMYRNF